MVFRDMVRLVGHSDTQHLVVSCFVPTSEGLQRTDRSLRSVNVYFVDIIRPTLHTTSDIDLLSSFVSHSPPTSVTPPLQTPFSLY